MDEVLKIVVMGRACRNTANIKNRQPIGNMFVKAPSCSCRSSIVEIIEDELNVKKVDIYRRRERFTKLHLQAAAAHRRTEVRQVAWTASRKHSQRLDGNAAMA